MSQDVIDASVLIKWFIPEDLTIEARRWRTVAHDLHAPDFLHVEAANILWKKVQRRDLTPVDARDVLTTIQTLPVTLHTASGLAASALELACETGRTVYDSLYLALAIALGGRMVTADRRLVNALASTRYAAHVCWVEDSP
jgi:predicted nucleic acid-binding protein